MQLKMIYWRDGEWWLGRLAERPDIMTQGATLEELEENLKDAWRLMVMEDVPAQHFAKEITVEA
jgi:predicted RNase H-like HicB family nuclease